MERTSHEGMSHTKEKTTMIHKKSLFHSTLLAALLGGSLFVGGLQAQEAGIDHPRPPHGPPPSPLFDALDTNHDGVISADEIANAPTALKALLKNGATQITHDDVRPPHPSREDQVRGGRPHDDQSRDDQARPHPQDTERTDHPPRSADDDARRMVDDHQHGSARSADQAERHHGPPPSPLFDALDTNHDGIISADEIDAAPDALRKLDKSGSGQIKREDLRPMHPPRDSD